MAAAAFIEARRRPDLRGQVPAGEGSWGVRSRVFVWVGTLSRDLGGCPFSGHPETRLPRADGTPHHRPYLRGGAAAAPQETCQDGISDSSSNSAFR